MKDYTHWLKTSIAAIKKLAVYPAGHPSRVSAVTPVYESLQSIMANSQKVVLSAVGDKFIVNGETIPELLTSNTLYATFHTENIHSIELRAGLSLEDFKNFLEFFARKTVDKTYNQPLDEYLKEKRLGAILINRYQYVALSEKEEVISKTERVRIDLKSQLVETLRRNPQILKEVLFQKNIAPDEFSRHFGIPLAPGQAGQLIEEELGNLPEEKIMELIAGKVRQEIENCLTGEAQKKEDLDKLLKALGSEEFRELFPKIEQILSRYGLVNTDLLHKLGSEEWKNNQRIVRDVTSLFDGKKQKQSDPDKLNSISERMLSLNNERVSEYLIGLAAGAMEDADPAMAQTARALLEKVYNLALIESREFEISFIHDICLASLNNIKLPEGTLKEVSGLASHITVVLLARKNYRLAREILLSMRTRCHVGVILPEGIQRISLGFLSDLASSNNLDTLIEDWLDGVDPQLAPQAEQILKLLCTENVAEALVIGLEITSKTKEDKIVSLLSAMPEASLPFSEKRIDLRLHPHTPKSGPEGVSIDTIKIKLIVRILSHIDEPQALQLLGKLRFDPDPHIRIEVVRALGSAEGQEAGRLLFGLLKDRDASVKAEVFKMIQKTSDPQTIQILINHFAEGVDDREAVCTALAQMEGESVVDFFQYLVTGKSKRGFKLEDKPDSKIKELALGYLSQHLTLEVLKHLEEYLETQGRNVFTRLKKDPMTDRIASIVSSANLKRPLPRGT